MRVLLIDPPGWQKHSLSLGLAYLAGAARGAGFDVQILDMNNHLYSNERIQKIVSDYAPQVIGISVKTATANVSAQIISRLKNVFPGITYVAGGPHITLCGKEFLQENKEIDLGVIGEGEASFVELIKNIQNAQQDVSKISGIFYRQSGNLILNTAYRHPDISKIPFPVFEAAKDIDFTEFRYPLLTSRGCPYGCIFCCVGLISGKQWRGREPEDVVSELAQAKEAYQMSLFEIMDDNFTLDVKRAKKICRLIIKKKLNLSWWCHNGLRADGLDQELLNLMKKAGCTSIALGIESGDESVFNNINKGEKLSDIVKAVKMIKKAQIKCVGYFIVGLPGDSSESTKRSVRFQRGLGLSDFKYNILIPYPGTKISQLVKEKGRLLTDIKGTYHFGNNLKIPFETDKLSKETLQECIHLAENQEWAAGEKEIIDIKNYFQNRFGRLIARIVLIEDDSKAVAQNLTTNCKEAKVLKIKTEQVPAQVADKYLLKADAQGSCFSFLIGLMQDPSRQVILDLPRRRLFMQSIKKISSEYVRDEILPPPLEWDSTPRRYFAARLKNSSPGGCSTKNGVVYKDEIALPFSHSPQWEKTPCGKIESGLAFISKAAFSSSAVYTADYVTSKSDSTLQELIMPQGQGCVIERILNEADVLFFPAELASSFLIFSGAKLLIGYSVNPGADFLRHKVLDPLSMGRWRAYAMKAQSVLASTRRMFFSLSRPFVVFIKGVKVLILWMEILVFQAKTKTKKFIFRTK
jgi:radical SAM superfamily enzyme YgiQ (UPF0313 family)